MQLPNGAGEYKSEKEIINVPGNNEACIENPHYGKQYITRFEALDIINMLSGMLMADERFKGVGPVRRTG